MGTPEWQEPEAQGSEAQDPVEAVGPRAARRAR